MIGTGSGFLQIDSRQVGSGAYAGKKVCIRNGDYTGLWVYIMKGTASQPMTLTNCGGQVVFNATTANAMAFEGSEFIRITGTGSAAHPYGIVAYGSTRNSSHIVDIKNGSTDLEVDHIEVKGATVDPLSPTVANELTGGVGIAYRSYPSCNSGAWVAGSWSQKNTKIHDNYIHDTRYEGIYAGPSHYGTVSANAMNPGFPCGAGTTLNGQRLVEAELDGVEIYNNRILRTGNDGLQLGAAVNGSSVRDNFIKDFGMNGDGSHSGGIMINPGTNGIFERNWIETTVPRSTQGISSHAAGGTIIRNNVVVGANYGVMMLRNTDYNMGITPREIKIYHNTVVGTAANGFQFYCGNFGTANLRVANNLWAGYAAATRGDDGQGTFCINSLSDNRFLSTVAAALFVPGGDQYRLQASSPAANSGLNLEGIVDSDYEGLSRVGQAYDQGAYRLSQ